MPLIIAPEEWRGLERALIQRARLFEGILADLYGPQRLLASGAIPHQLVFSDPSFLRPCQDLRPAGRLHPVLRHRLARGPDGRWRVIDTHTETPAGIGYALANRMVHTNVAGDIFSAPARRCGWRRSSSSCRPRWRGAPIAPTRPSPC